MYLTETHIINSSNEIDSLLFKCKNLYNKANYIIRQEFINNGNFLTTYDMYSIMKDYDEYKCLLSRVARPVLRTLNSNWKIFFSNMKNWTNSSLSLGKPNIPKYLPKQSKFTAIFIDCSIKNKTLKNSNIIGLSKLNIEIPYQNSTYPIIEVQVIPMKTDKIKINIVYEKKIKPSKENNDRYCSIDLGVNNLMTVTSNIGEDPFIINGRVLKSINQFYNKRKSELQKKLPKGVYTSKKINKLTFKRNMKINDYLHKSSNIVVKYCVNNNINSIIIGYNKYWKQNINIGKSNNQNFTQIPFYKMKNMLKYKAEINGISLIEQEESFTSVCSFIDNEDVKYQKKYQGKRIKRGLFESKNHVLINSDVNGSYNIMRKVVSNFSYEEIEDIAVYPKLINIV